MRSEINLFGVDRLLFRLLLLMLLIVAFGLFMKQLARHGARKLLHFYYLLINNSFLI